MLHRTYIFRKSDVYVLFTTLKTTLNGIPILNDIFVHDSPLEYLVMIDSCSSGDRDMTHEDFDFLSAFLFFSDSSARYRQVVDLHSGHLFGGQSLFAFQLWSHFTQLYIVGTSFHLYVPHEGHLRGESSVDLHS
jgi:hypothetical protein